MECGTITRVGGRSADRPFPNSGMMSEEDLAAVADDDVTYTPLLNALADDIQFLGQLNPRSTKSSKRRMATRRSLSQTNNQAKGKSKIK